MASLDLVAVIGFVPIPDTTDGFGLLISDLIEEPDFVDALLLIKVTGLVETSDIRKLCLLLAAKVPDVGLLVDLVAIVDLAAVTRLVLGFDLIEATSGSTIGSSTRSWL